MSRPHITLPKTLQEAILYFASEDNCLAYLVAKRWPDGVTCPTCGSKEVTSLKNQRRWKCRVDHERRQFSVKVGSIMEDSPVPLSKCLPAMWMITNAKNGISSCEIARALGVMQKTAWFLLHRIRYAMQQGSFEKMSGQIEADETYIGGLARNMHKDKKAKKITGTGGSGKAIVMGLLERHGIDKSQKIIDIIGTAEKKASRVGAKVIQNTDKDTLHGEVKEHVKPGSELFTDAHLSYRGLDPEYVHQFVDHAEAYVKDQVVHTNGLENFWSLLKRGIKGTYVSVEPFHLTRYVDEQAFRFNERKLTDSERFMEVASSVAGKRLTYKHLTGKTPEPSIA